MDLDFGESFSKYAANPIYVAIAILLIMILIFYLSVSGSWNGKKNVSLGVAVTRFGIYTAVACGLALAVHNSAVERKYKTINGCYEMEKMTAAAAGSAVAMSVKPKISGGAEGSGEGGTSGVGDGSLTAGLSPSCVVYGTLPAAAMPGMRLAQPAIAVSPAYGAPAAPPQQFQ